MNKAQVNALRTPLTHTNAIIDMQKGGTTGIAMNMDWTYYDTYKIENTKVSYRFFTESLGQANKTKAETNLQTPGAMPQGHTFRCHALKVMFLGNGGLLVTNPEMAAAFNGFFWNSVLEIKFQGKDSLGTWTLHELLGMSAVYLFNDDTNQNPQQPFLQYKNVFPLNNSILFPAQQSFVVEVSLNCGGVSPHLVNSFLRIGLNGQLDRLV